MATKTGTKSKKKKLRDSVASAIEIYHEKIDLAISLTISGFISMLNLIVIVVYWINFHTQQFSKATSITYWIIISSMLLVTVVNVIEIIYIGQFKTHHALILISNIIFLPIFFLSQKDAIKPDSIFKNIQKKIIDNLVYFDLAYFTLNCIIVVSIVSLGLNIFRQTKKKAK